MICFYDFEVFKYDWLVVIWPINEDNPNVIMNNRTELCEIFNAHRRDFWIGFNNVHYDQYIMKSILCDFNPKEVNDYIIKDGKPGWKFSSLFNEIEFINYDVMTSLDRGLKAFEGFMGNNIKESSVPFDINRKLTRTELDETIKYCKHDVEQTIEIFKKRQASFDAHFGLVKLAGGNLNLMSKTKPSLAAIILDAKKRPHNDEFNIDFPKTLRLQKYISVVNWYKDPKNHCYSHTLPNRKTPIKSQCEIEVAGVMHQFGWGGVHGAISQYHSKGSFLNMDVTSLYPSLMIQYNLFSRNMRDPQKFIDMYHQRIVYKRQNNPIQNLYKLVLNSTYGVMKDPNNALYDPLQANKICVYGQLLILDLIEHLEPYCKIIQSNTDGVLVKLGDKNKIMDVVEEWETRTKLNLEFKEYVEIFQKDVNNYVLIDNNGQYKSKGAYVKKLNPLDYDLPIVNKALIDYMVNKIPIEDTINKCNDLKEFQLIAKISNKYSCIKHGDKTLKEKCIRIFASKDKNVPGVVKIHAKTLRSAKIPNSPSNCFIFNDAVNNVPTPSFLDKNWYIELAKKRIKDFL